MGRRLVAAGRLLASDPATAHAHALEATRVASRVAAVREACGVTAYAIGDWNQALLELRAARRLSGSFDFLPMEADCERGLGRPERALLLAGNDSVKQLDKAGRVEMRIVASGARRDLGQLDAAVVTLQCPELKDMRKPWSARLAYAYADALDAAGRRDQAITWFVKAAAADPEGETEAAERLDELEGTVFVEVEEDVELIEAAEAAEQPDPVDQPQPGDRPEPVGVEVQAEQAGQVEAAVDAGPGVAAVADTVPQPEALLPVGIEPVFSAPTEAEIVLPPGSPEMLDLVFEEPQPQPPA